MTTVINPDEYCKNPQDYKNTPGIDNQTRAYWDDYCNLKKQVQNATPPDRGDLANASAQAVSQFIEMMIEPVNLAMMGAIFGAPMLAKTAKASIGMLFKNGLTPDTIETVEGIIAKGGDAYLANSSAIFFDFFKYADFALVDIGEKAGYSAGKMAVLELIESMGELTDMVFSILDPIMMVMLVVQLVGMVFDAYDVCNLNAMLDAEALETFSDLFNKGFRENVLVSVNSTVDSYGHTTLLANWPLTYYADNAIIPFKNDYYDNIKRNLYFNYIMSLQINSDGQPIKYVKGGKAISNEDIQGIELEALSLFGNNNTVVENFLVKWWPLILGIVMFILGIIIVKFVLKK